MCSTNCQASTDSGHAIAMRATGTPDCRDEHLPLPANQRKEQQRCQDGLHREGQAESRPPGPQITTFEQQCQERDLAEQHEPVDVGEDQRVRHRLGGERAEHEDRRDHRVEAVAEHAQQQVQGDEHGDRVGEDEQPAGAFGIDHGDRRDQQRARRRIQVVRIDPLEIRRVHRLPVEERQRRVVDRCEVVGPEAVDGLDHDTMEHRENGQRPHNALDHLHGGAGGAGLETTEEHYGTVHRSDRLVIDPPRRAPALRPDTGCRSAADRRSPDTPPPGPARTSNAGRRITGACQDTTAHRAPPR